MLALLLWGPTVLGAAWWASRAQPDVVVPRYDDRIMLDFSLEEHATMHRMMRLNVVALDGILRAWAANDRAGMAAAARIAARDHPTVASPSLEETLPPEWRVMGRVVHQELESFAEDVGGLTDAEIPGRLATVTAACVACHDTFQYRAVAR